MGDPVEDARLLARVREAVLSGAVPPVAPREVVSESWRRSLAGGVDPEADLPPLVYAPDDLAELRERHPLARALPLLRSTLVSIADEAMHLMIVTDAEGHILWREGQADVCLLADRVGLAEGTRWSEDAIGTNAMGTTLVLDRPVGIHSAEHLVGAYRDWTCAAAPVHDPDTGALLGAIDVTGPASTRHPATLALVTAAAQLAEGRLRLWMAARDEQLRRLNRPHLVNLREGALLSPTGRVIAARSRGPLPGRVAARPGAQWLPDGREAVVEPLAEGYLLRVTSPARRRPRPRVVLSFLGATRPTAVVDGREHALTPRHAEILTLLALRPHGLTAEQLALALHGESGNPATARAEVHRLRAALGVRVVPTRPYRLAAEVTADFLALPELLRAGLLREAAAAGPLLPRSDAPAVRDHREELLACVRRAVLDRGDAEDLWTYTRGPNGADDVEAHETLVGLLDRHDPRLPLARAHLDRLTARDQRTPWAPPTRRAPTRGPRSASIT